MESSVAQKTVNEKSNSGETKRDGETKTVPIGEFGAEAGMPIFLKRAPDAISPASVIQRSLGARRERLKKSTQSKSNQMLETDQTGSIKATKPDDVATLGVSQANGCLSNQTRIQNSFGRHDISGVRTQIGGPAAEASRKLGAHAYTLGQRIGFKDQPDLRLQAHEAAHTIQQKKGVSRKGIIGQPDDVFEQQADAVADRVVSNQSAEDILDQKTDANFGRHQPQANTSVEEPDDMIQLYPEDRVSVQTNNSDAGPADSPSIESGDQEDADSDPEAIESGDRESETAGQGEAKGLEDVEDQPDGEDSATEEEQDENAGGESVGYGTSPSRSVSDPSNVDPNAGGGEADHSGDLALIDAELAEHERWAGSFGEVGTAGSDQRAQFILDQAGQGASSGAISGFGMGFVMGAVGGAIGQIAGRRLATLAVSRGFAATPVPGLGSAIGGLMALAGLAMRDWGNTFDTIGRFGEGEGYAGLANDLEAIAEILDLASNVADVIAGVLGGIAVGMWVGAVLSAGTLSPLAASLTAVALAINIATTAIGVIINVVIRPTVTALRALHAFESQGDPAQIEAEGQQLQAAAGQVTGAIAGAAGGRLGGAAGSRGGARLDSAARRWQESGAGSSPTTTGAGPQVHVEAPDSSSTSPSSLRPLDQGPHPVTPDVVIQGDYSDPAISVNSSGRRTSGQASVGDIGPHRLQGTRGDTMISEHVAPGAQVRDATRDPAQGGTPDWQRTTPGGSDGRDYNNATTIIEHAAVASRKTQADNAATAALQQAGNPRSLTDDLLLPSLERHQRAVDDAIAAGEITPSQATDPTHRALAAQAELWEAGGAGGGARARAEAEASGARLTNPRRTDRRRAQETQRRQDRLNNDPEGVAGFDEYDWDATFSNEPSTNTSHSAPNEIIVTGTMPFGGIGGSQGRVAARDELVEQAQDETDPRRPQLGPAYTAAVAVEGLEPGASMDVPINPAYPAPPGSTAELDALQEQVARSRAAQEELETTENRMQTQAGEQTAQAEQLVEADAITQDIQSGRTAHQSTTDETLSTNSQQQSTATDTISTLGRGAEEASGLYTLITSLRGFQGLAQLFSYLPGSLGRSAENARDDAEGLITSLNRVSETEAVEADVAQGQVTMETNQGTIEATGDTGEETDQELEQGRQGVNDLATANSESLDETEAVEQQASRERAQAENSEEESQTAHDELLSQLQSWATEHQQARQDAIDSAIEAYNAQGYQARDGGN